MADCLQPAITLSEADVQTRVLATPDSPVSMETQYRPNDSYVSMMPCPPRIQLLRPYSPTGRRPEPHSSPDPPEFLKLVDLKACLEAAERLAVNWSYEQRHVAQQILPFLYLGSRVAARDTKFLHDAGITMMVTLRNPTPFESKRFPRALVDAQNRGIITPIFDVHSNQSLISTIPNAVRTINDHLNHANAATQPSSKDQIQGAVLVCCDSGNDRSAAVVIAYIMENFSLDLLQAHRVVQNRRFCIAIDDPMKQTLRSYEDIIKARRDVGQSPNGHAANSTATQLPNQPNFSTLRLPNQTYKRTREADSDDDMENAGDEERFERRGFTPFQE